MTPPLTGTRVPFGAELLERDVEVELARRVFDPEPDAPRLLVVEGPAGIGKTRFLQAMRAGAADNGHTILHARGSELEQEFAFGVVRQLFEPALAVAGPEVFAGAARFAGHLFFPAAWEQTPAEASEAALHGLYWLAINVAAERPLLLLVDDAHWADPASLRFLVYLANRLDERQLTLAVALRPYEPGAELELLDRLAAVPAATRVVLQATERICGRPPG